MFVNRVNQDLTSVKQKGISKEVLFLLSDYLRYALICIYKNKRRANLVVHTPLNHLAPRYFRQRMLADSLDFLGTPGLLPTFGSIFCLSWICVEFVARAISMPHRINRSAQKVISMNHFPVGTGDPSTATVMANTCQSTVDLIAESRKENLSSFQNSNQHSVIAVIFAPITAMSCDQSAILCVVWSIIHWQASDVYHPQIPKNLHLLLCICIHFSDDTV